MSIQDWGAVGEVVGAIAVLITLIYLAKQIKHSSEVAKIASYHQGIGQIVQSAMAPDFSVLAAKIEEGESLSPEEQMRSDTLSSAFIYGHEILLHLYRRGQVDEVLWENIFSNNLHYLMSKMMLPVLQNRPGVLSQELCRLVETAIDAGGLGDRPQPVAPR
jgi:hypothetical protein